MSISFSDTDEGWDDMQKAFDVITPKDAAKHIDGVYKDFGGHYG